MAKALRAGDCCPATGAKLAAQRAWTRHERDALAEDLTVGELAIRARRDRLHRVDARIDEPEPSTAS